MHFYIHTRYFLSGCLGKSEILFYCSSNVLSGAHANRHLAAEFAIYRSRHSISNITENKKNVLTANNFKLIITVSMLSILSTNQLCITYSLPAR